MYRPDSLVTTVSAVCRSTLVIVTVAPGTMLPEVSVMMPETLPYTAWARAFDVFGASVSSASTKIVLNGTFRRRALERKSRSGVMQRSSIESRKGGQTSKF